jgi:metal-dependent HD superfamily phosphatase/phosphodiesterase
VPCKENKKLEKIVDLVNKDVQLQTYWKCANVMAIDRMGYTDHGPTHVKIVANIGLRLLRILTAKGILPSIVKDYGLLNDDAEVIVVLASIFHDLGMIIAREHHEEYSIFLALDTLQRYLSVIYTSKEKRAIITSEVLQAMLAHQPKQKALTLEAGIVRVADSLDMEQGRARIPFESGKIDIHSVSALSIEEVEISEGLEKPIIIKIRMLNSAGIFQIDELLKAKIQNSGLEKYVHVVAEISGEKERRIVEKFEI